MAATYGLGDARNNAPTEALHPSTSGPATDITNDRWWQAFGDARLDRLITKVLTINTDLASAGLRLKIVRLTAGLATHQLWPHIDASVDTSKTLSGNTHASRSSSVSTTVSYELDLWGKLRAQRDASQWEAQATAEDLQSTALALVGDTASLYWTLAFLNQRIAAGQESLARLQKTLALVQSQFDVGAVSRLEVREAEQNLQSQQTAQSQLTQQRVEIRNAITVLLNVHPWPQNDEPQTLNDARSPPIHPGIPAELMGRRPDLRAAELRLRESLTTIDITKTSYYPAISLTGSVGGSSTTLSDVLANPVATLGAGLSFPFLHWNEMRLNVAIASADSEIAANDFRRALYTAFTEVENALSARTELTRQLESSQKSFDNAIEIEHLYEVRYRAGATPLRFWLDAQETRRTAELSLAQARLNQLENDSTLFQALGGSGT